MIADLFRSEFDTDFAILIAGGLRANKVFP